MKKTFALFALIPLLCSNQCSLTQRTDSYPSESDSVSYASTGRHIDIKRGDPMSTYKFTAEEFYSLTISSSFKVTMCDTVDSIVVSVNDKLKKFLEVKYTKGMLKIGFDRSLHINSDGTPCGYVTIPYNVKLCSFYMSGSSSFKTKLPIAVKTFSLNMSGMTEFESNVTAVKSELSLSGSSTYKGKLHCNEAEMSLSGMTAVTGSLKADEAEINLSGSSSVKCNMDVNEIEASLSGMSQLTANGKVNRMDFDLSGSSSLNMSSIQIAEIEGSMSGMSNAEVKCSKFLKMDLSGSSNLTYSGNPKTMISKSGMATANAVGR